QYQLHAKYLLNATHIHTGDKAKALQVSDDLNKVPGSSAELTTNLRINFTTRTLLELHRLKQALALALEGNSQDRQMIYLLHTIAAARTGDARLSEESLKSLKKSGEGRHRDKFLENYRRSVAEAWVDYAKGK